MLAPAQPSAPFVSRQVSQSAVVARPEKPNANVVRVGQMLIIPLYDGRISVGEGELPAGLRLVGKITIPHHDLLHDLQDRSAFGGFDASSNVGEAFIMRRPMRGSINVLLTLPQLKEKCVSCRTLHFFYRGTNR